MRKQAEEIADIFNVFSNSKRVLIFWGLNGQEMSVNDIAQAIDTSIQNASQHLRLMKSKDILEARRDGQMIYYRVAPAWAEQYGRLFDQEVLAEYMQPPPVREHFLRPE